ncbi:hypothetical protein NL676_020483 [Syzygium grande]|nr:hypothetical protein NL676_020483 [Syzygium grande]
MLEENGGMREKGPFSLVQVFNGQADGYTVEKISLLASPNQKRPARFWGVYTKLKTFNMTSYKKNHSERLNSGVMVVEPSETVFSDMMGKVQALCCYTGEVLKSRPVPEMERLSTLYNADVGLYMLANKWMVDESELRVIHYTLGPPGYLHLVYKLGRAAAVQKVAHADDESGKDRQRQTTSCDIATCCYWSGMAFLAMVDPALPCIFGITALFARNSHGASGSNTARASSSAFASTFITLLPPLPPPSPPPGATVRPPGDGGTNKRKFNIRIHSSNRRDEPGGLVPVQINYSINTDSSHPVEIDVGIRIKISSDHLTIMIHDTVKLRRQNILPPTDIHGESERRRELRKARERSGSLRGSEREREERSGAASARARREGSGGRCGFGRGHLGLRWA